MWLFVDTAAQKWYNNLIVTGGKHMFLQLVCRPSKQEDRKWRKDIRG